MAAEITLYEKGSGMGDHIAALKGVLAICRKTYLTRLSWRTVAWEL